MFVAVFITLSLALRTAAVQFEDVEEVSEETTDVEEDTAE